MDASEIRGSVARNRQALSEAIAQVPMEAISEPGLAGGWSVKDVMAHVAWWDLRMCRRFGLAAGLEIKAPDLWPAESKETDATAWADDINRQVRNHHAQMPADEVRKLYESAGAAVATTLDAIGDEQLAPGSALEQAVGRPVVEAISVDTLEHYPEHTQAIRQFLEPT